MDVPWGFEEGVKPLRGIRILTLALNLPGPMAIASLQQLGATVVKVEPPDGDPLAHVKPHWYRALHEGQEILCLNLKDTADRARLEERLQAADLLVTAARPAALRRLGLAREELHARCPSLCQVAIVGYPPPEEGVPGHDLTYQARLGLVEPPNLPRILIADLAGAQQTVQAALALLLARARGQGGHAAWVSLARAAEWFAEPLRQRLTGPGELLGGGFAGYHLYRAQEGWVALAALEPHFWHKLLTELGLAAGDRQQLQEVFLTRTAREWESWGSERDLPLVAVRDLPLLEDPRQCMA
jgi:crotonobetainyl-CoA:carnitine CoA-transferase CaiB-like acyl-CoA transferase